jgi:hypothetical protein
MFTDMGVKVAAGLAVSAEPPPPPPHPDRRRTLQKNIERDRLVDRIIGTSVGQILYTQDKPIITSQDIVEAHYTSSLPV